MKNVCVMQTLEYIEETLPQETPNAFGLHANAGIGFRLREAERFAEQLNSLQPRKIGGGAGASIEEKAKIVSLSLQLCKYPISSDFHCTKKDNQQFYLHSTAVRCSEASSTPLTC